MPRGVYKRRGKGVPVPPAAPASKPVAPQAPAPEPIAVAAVVHECRGPRGIRIESRDVEALSGADLRAYALQVGVGRRDCEHLSEDRLRQNVRIVIQTTYDLLTE